MSTVHAVQTAMPDYAAFTTALVRTGGDFARLQGAASLLAEAGMASQAEDGLDRLASGVFRIGIIGDFKRGKSTLANALLGARVMPSDILPLTAALTRVVYGREPGATLHLRDGSVHPIKVENLEKHVTKINGEAASNAARVAEAVVAYPTRLCLNGVELVDTPGLGDDGEMTERALAILPTLDAAIMVTSAQFSFSETELRILERLRDLLGPQRLFLVANKIDMIRPSERDKLIANTADRAASILGEPARLFAVSAEDAMEAKRDGDDGKLSASGFKAFEETLESFLVSDSGLARLRASNAMLGDLARAAMALVETQLAQQKAGEADAQARLADLEENLDRTVADINNWAEGVGGRREALMETVIGMLKAFQDTLRQVAMAELDKITFGTDDVQNPGSRHARVARQINPALLARHRLLTEQVQATLRNYLDEVSLALTGFSSRWDSALGNDMHGAASNEEIDHAERTALETLQEAIGPGLDEVLKKSDAFATHYAANCQVDSAGSFGARMWGTRDSALAAAGKLKTDYRNQLGDVIGRALVAVNVGAAVDDCLETADKAFDAFVNALADRINASLQERKWILRLQREQIERDRGRDVERLSTASTAIAQVLNNSIARDGGLDSLTPPPSVIPTPQPAGA